MKAAHAPTLELWCVTDTVTNSVCVCVCVCVFVCLSMQNGEGGQVLISKDGVDLTQADCCDSNRFP